MPVIVHLDPDSYVPPFEQLRSQIAESARIGELAAGDRLPPVRHLATELGLAPNTVARAYRELEAAGVVEARGRHGTFVRPTTQNTGNDEEAATAAMVYASHIAALGITAERGLALVHAAVNARAPISTTISPRSP